MGEELFQDDLAALNAEAIDMFRRYGNMTEVIVEKVTIADMPNVLIFEGRASHLSSSYSFDADFKYSLDENFNKKSCEVKVNEAWKQKDSEWTKDVHELRICERRIEMFMSRYKGFKNFAQSLPVMKNPLMKWLKSGKTLHEYIHVH